MFRRIHWFNTLRPKQDCYIFTDNIFICFFLNENAWVSIKISLQFVPKVPINNIAALVQIVALRRPVHKPLSEPLMVRLLMHKCITRPQWVKMNLWLVGIIIMEVCSLCLLSRWGHQQPLYWLCDVLSSCLPWERIMNCCNFSVWQNDVKCIYMFIFHPKYFNM